MWGLETAFPNIRLSYKDDMSVMKKAEDQIRFIQDSHILIKPHGNNMANRKRISPTIFIEIFWVMFLPKCAIAIQLYPKAYYIGFDK